MKFSFLTYLFYRYPLEYCFEIAKRYGFEGIEIWGGRPHAYAYDLNNHRIDDINKWKNKYNLEISMFTPEVLAYPYSLTSRLEEERRDTVDYLLKSVEVTALIGANKMQVVADHPGYHRSHKEVWNNLIENLKRICDKAEEMNVEIVIEAFTPSEGNLITKAEDLYRLLEEIESTSLKAMIDVVPPVVANEPFSEYFNRLKDKIAYIHFSNSDGVTEQHILLDDPKGVIPAKEMFSIFKNYGYNGWCSLELLVPYFKDPELYLLQTVNLVNKICNEIGIARN